ncbi:MAG TPA: hypothetical protein VK447_14490 [Myxococcaceae bacterium]|nr:hypothetical protein [Myxococcaceae bacterium]
MKLKIHAAGPSERAMRPGEPDDPRSYPHHEWGAPGLPATPWDDPETLRARDRELRREGDASDTSSIKTQLGERKDDSPSDYVPG